MLVARRFVSIDGPAMYVVIKTVKGRRYRYLQRSWREGSRVRTQTEYLGPVDNQPKRRRSLGQKIGDLIRTNTTCHPDDFFTEEMLAQYNARFEQEEQARLAKLDDLYAKYGLHLANDRPDLRAAAKAGATAAAVPETPAPTEQNVAQPSESAAEESPSVDEGQGSGDAAADAAQNS
jgi:DUF1680 family protein